MGLDVYPWLKAPALMLEKLRQKLPSAVLIYGQRGCGVYELAASFARSILCEHPVQGGACGQCASCKLTEAGTHPDLRLVLSPAEEVAHPQPWAVTKTTSESKKGLSRQIPIEKIRSLGEFLSTTSHRGGNRVVLIYPANMMLADQSSALLKNLEEPPAGTTIVLATDDLDAMLPTIRSRCQLVRVPFPPKAQAQQFLRENGVKDPESTLASFGGMPLLLFEKDVKLRLSEDVEAILLDLLLKGNQLKHFQVFDALNIEIPLPAFIAYIQRFVCDLIYATQGLAVRYNVKKQSEIISLAQNLDVKPLLAYWSEAEKMARMADHPLNAKLTIQTFILKYSASVVKKSA